MDKRIDFIYCAWVDALARTDVVALLALYAADATLESPSVPKPMVRRQFRTGCLDGRLLVWEYPRAAPDGEQMDFVEVMEIAD